jgi:hypothetical protein
MRNDKSIILFHFTAAEGEFARMEKEEKVATMKCLKNHLDKLFGLKSEAKETS